MLTNATYEPDDTDAAFLLDGTPIDPEWVIEMGNTPWRPRTFVTQVALLDRLGRIREYGLLIVADNIEQARLRAQIRGLGEVVTGEVECPEDIIPVEEA